MNGPINILIVDNNHHKNSEKALAIKEHGLSHEVKVAMNSGHALLYLDHIHLNQKINDTQLIIILNMETPISNGYEFLSTYHNSTNFKKERIHIIVINDNLCEEKKEKIKKLGVTNFIQDPFPVEIINKITKTQTPNNTSGKNASQETSNKNVQPHSVARP